MFNNIIQPGARYPGLTSRDDIHANRQWVLKVMQGNIQVPTIEDLGHDGYFRCPRESESIMIEKFEAWQMIGVTNMTNDEISLNGMHKPVYYNFFTVGTDNQSSYRVMAKLASL